jgi:hypothetical protein
MNKLKEKKFTMDDVAIAHSLSRICQLRNLLNSLLF